MQIVREVILVEEVLSWKRFSLWMEVSNVVLVKWREIRVENGQNTVQGSEEISRIGYLSLK